MRHTMESTPPHLQSQSTKKDTPAPPDQDQQMESHPIPENHHPVSMLQRSDLSKPKPPAPLPSPHNEDVHLNTGSSPPTETDGPPPLPDRSPLSQEVQHSVMKPSPTPKEPPLSPVPYEIPEPYKMPLHSRTTNMPLCMQHVHRNGFCETQQQDALDGNAIVDATAIPINTELYIHVDPMVHTQSQQSQQRKPKPLRPPPPSKSAIRKAQRRKANHMASSKPAVKSSSKVSHSNSHTPTVRTDHPHKNTPCSTSLPLTRSFALTQQTSEYEVEYEVIDADYEDIDAGFSPAPPSLSSLPAANQSRKFGSEPHRGTPPTPSPTRPPTLPPIRPPIRPPILPPTRPPLAAPTNKARQGPRSTPVSSAGIEYDLDSVYEPVGTSIHPTPLCTKRNTRGDQIHNKAKQTSHYELDDEAGETRPHYMSLVSDRSRPTSHYELDDEAGEMRHQYMSLVSGRSPQTSHYELDDEDI